MIEDPTTSGDGARPQPRLGWRVAERPAPAFAHVLGAAAGAFAVVAIVAFVVETTSDDPTAPGVVFTGGLALAALLAGIYAAGPIRSACVTALVLCVPLLWIFAVFGGGNVSRGDIRLVYLLIAASYLVLYLLTWTKGRAVLLAGVLIFVAGWITFEVAGSGSTEVVPFQSQFDTSQSGSSLGNFTTSSSDTSSSTAAAALVVGLVFLGVGAALDGRRLEGAATPFVAIGAAEAIAGAVVLGGNESVVLGGVLAIATGTVVGIVGGHGDRRRATTWIGVLTVFGGMVAILVDIAPSSAAGVGGIAVGFALVLGLIAWLLAPRLGEPDDGDDRPVPPTPPSPTGDTTPSEPAPDDTADAPTIEDTQLARSTSTPHPEDPSLE
jgi:hypothetical protein